MPLSTAYSDCAEGIYRTRASVDSISTSVNGGSVGLYLPEGACYVGFNVSRPSEQWPNWPWLAEGAQLDISLWGTGAGTRGGDPLWLVIRDSVTGDPVMTIYQLNGALIEDGRLLDEVGIDANIVGPVCENTDLAEEGLREHGYEVRFSSEGKRITLGEVSEGSLPSSNASLVWKIQTGVLKNRLLEPNATVLDVRQGEFFHFVAWTEPR